MDNLSYLINPVTSWYRKNKKPLPWRIDGSAYHIWISEIMLQQTRIEAVIPYYYRFINRLPDIKSLALCDDDELMKLWEGLGYYSRVRNLKKAAQLILSEYGGEMPQTAALLRKLPGIGEYTAGAIASVAFGKPEPAVDGNVLRVITRVTADSSDIADLKTKSRISNELRIIYPSGKMAGELTEGLMEIGENLCIPNGTPICDQCPLNDVCRAHKENLTDKIPFKSPKKARRIEEKSVFLIKCNNRYALNKRSGSGLLSGMWEFPNCEGKLTTKQVAKQFGVDECKVTKLTDAKHIFSHIEWHMTGFLITIPNEMKEFIFETVDIIRENYAIPTAFKPYLNLI